jgi:hypothetical protein
VSYTTPTPVRKRSDPPRVTLLRSRGGSRRRVDPGPPCED